VVQLELQASGEGRSWKPDVSNPSGAMEIYRQPGLAKGARLALVICGTNSSLGGADNCLKFTLRRKATMGRER
jgi:hypothetical protein